MTRSKWKSPFVDSHILNKFNDAQEAKRATNKLKTWSRRSTIQKDWVGQKIEVYNGLKFIPIVIREEMVSSKLGALVFTRKKAIHKKKVKKRK